MGKKRNLFIPVIVVILLIAVAFWLGELKPADTVSSDVDEMVQRVENALGDYFKGKAGDFSVLAGHSGGISFLPEGETRG